MSQYFNSNNIKVYPTAKRTAEFNYPANLNTEQNITNLSNSIVDIKNYIVEGLSIIIQTISSNKYAVITPGKCVINGYSIETVSNQQLPDALNTANTYYVYLTLDMINRTISEGSVNFTLSEINGIDDEHDKYTGVNIELLTAEKVDTINSLLLAKLTYTNHWVVELTPEKLKFEANKTRISIYPNWGLSNTLVQNSNQIVYVDSLQNWLANDFIIDDGNIIE